jgi:hypothetical protein
LFDDVFLFDHLPGGQWVAAGAVVIGWIVVHRVLKHRRRREQLRRRRQIRARLHAPPAPAPAPAPTSAPTSAPPLLVEINLTEPARVVDLRDGVVYGSEITLESGDTLESGIVGPD